ncbi:SDR family NAD(P)-dependent oxidoreductase [Chitinophaga pinensis]|uniref:Short-chain dehydrogenase/reductase SDR n=1 Tax=Chitinophaga pinensis (strain ATCC 43595 / DSM 2588 / LMG 13176 / NBRC 15968 / NCIMB 11800 / UQM 2034) TaxID=485918 RepID=A0A979GXL6_CHIPD|nr:SDR family NAD(P)-dependent oxidoreductase [Chitinophaga pinensis]ACU61265.1 short-chain dehydrogenase/reductase SDR [Chitinophaga pinensis DSM 2588]
MNSTKTWYITGASKGIGLSLVKQLLSKGHRVAATSRNPAGFGETGAGDSNFLPLEVDLTNKASVTQSFAATKDRFGVIDVVVNNAGYGLGAALEELSDQEIEENFEVNFFAAVKVITAALPYFRSQRSGFIINISSIAGFSPGLGWSMYSAAKFALSGLSEALANDLKPLGIHVTNVMPGWFRTNFAKPDSIAFSNTKMEEYAYLREAHNKMQTIDGAQLGNPEKVADVFIALINAEQPPVNLFLGSDAFNRAKTKISQLQAEMSIWETLSHSTDFK